ncbi:MAG: glycosyltransferase family 9 protein [Prevotellaceae bacterium]|jgi:ADP-heptose:LPS heptosyltransferase|nr:glycosyltransferase family 9 protein [Prevotellaceae bacterium]
MYTPLPPKIIVSRTDSIGDVVLTLPMAGLLKQLIPGCEVYFLGRAYTRGVASCCTDVDKLIDFDALCGRSEQEQVEALKALRADCIIHVFPNRHVARLAKAARIPLRIGTANRIFHWTTCNKLVKLSRKNSPLHEAQLNFVLARPLGAKPYYDVREVASMLSFSATALPLPLRGYLDGQRFNLVLHPKSKGSAREWGLDNFAQLVELLPPERFKIFVTGTQAEGDMVRDTLINPYADRVTDLTGKFSLDELVAFLANVDGIVAASTGPLHIAAALGVNAVGVYPPIRPMHPGRWAPIGERAKVFAAQKECSACRKSGQCLCMQEVKPVEVAKYLLERSSHPEAPERKKKVAASL